MSIKQNMKRRLLMVLALAMTVAVLAAGTANAQAPPPTQTSLTQTTSSPKVVVGEPVTFHTTLTNESPFDISPTAVDTLPDSRDVQFVSASSSQGQCTFEPTHTEKSPNGDVHCDLGMIPPGGTAQIDVVVVPQKNVGAILNEVAAPMSSSSAKVFVAAA